MNVRTAETYLSCHRAGMRMSGPILTAMKMAESDELMRAQLEAQAGFDNKTTDASARARGSHILQAIAIASLGTGVGLLTGNAVRGRWRRRASSSSLGSARGSTSIVPTGTGFAVRGQF